MVNSPSKERTPTQSAEAPKQISTHLTITNKAKEDGEEEETPNNNSCNSKGKNPYYFTFFNEKNEQQTGSNEESTEPNGNAHSSFDKTKASPEPQSQNQPQMFTLNYHKTLDHDKSRSNKPIRGNHRTGGSTHNPTSPSPHAELRKPDSRIKKRELIVPEPTPSFNSKKQASANNSKP